MSTSTSYRRVAPADHFSPARAQLGELTRHVASLRKAMPLRSRLASGAHFGIVSAAAAIVAYIPTRALGLSQDFWSAITAIAVVQSEFHATQTTARDQFLGAALGGIAGLVTLLSFGQHLAVYAVAVIA